MFFLGGVSSVLPIAISIIVTYLLIFTLIYDGKGEGVKFANVTVRVADYKKMNKIVLILICFHQT